MENKISFKELVVWQKAMDLVSKVYELTKLLPKDEMYGITSHVRRSAVSIPSNISEGSKRGSRKDYCQFLKMANGSAAELETQLLLIQKIYSLEIGQVTSILVEVQKMLTVIIKKLDIR